MSAQLSMFGEELPPVKKEKEPEKPVNKFRKRRIDNRLTDLENVLNWMMLTVDKENSFVFTAMRNGVLRFGKTGALIDRWLYDSLRSNPDNKEQRTQNFWKLVADKIANEEITTYDNLIELVTKFIDNELL